MADTVTLHINKEAHKFSAAHYTIFSASERERLHGHNYAVSARIVAVMGENGFAADYNVYKRLVKNLCDELDEYMLLAENSPWQQIRTVGDDLEVLFAGKTLRFPVDETRVLPITNVTIEELSGFLLSRLVSDCLDDALVELEVGVSSGAGQLATSVWRRS